MRRREFIAGLGSVAAWPLAARAQQDERMRRIGVLLPGDENDPLGKARISAFTQALTDLGWADGRNVPHLFGRERHVMPFALEITAGDFAFAAGHRLTAISLVVGTLNSAAAFSIAVASSAASKVPSRTALAAIL